LSLVSRLKSFCFLHFSTPSPDRAVYRAILECQATKILHLGVGDGKKSLRLIEAALKGHTARDIQFTGIDWFEARPSLGHAWSLKEAHRILRTTGVRVRLIPGDPWAALAENANALGKLDVLLLSCPSIPGPDAPVWHYVPRLLHERSVLFVDTAAADTEAGMQQLSRSEVEAMAKAAAAARRRAA
jgi:hypothetical protein